MTRQRTLARSVQFDGIGLHTGNPSKLHALPAPAGHGIIFRRTDVPGNPEIPARMEFVSEVSRGTTLQKDGIKVHTVEHVVAALFGLNIDNALIELHGDEPPAADGSALPFVKLFQEAGFAEQDAEASYCSLKTTFSVVDGDKTITYIPADDFQVSFTLAYPEPVPLSQHLHVRVTPEDFAREVAFSRTFGFEYEFEMLRSRKLALGGSLENAVVIRKDGGVMNPDGLRSETEFVRHKILDLIGDLALMGRRVRGHVVANKTGHAYNVRFARKFCELHHRELERKSAPMMNVEAIKEILPHRYPFLLVDRILSIEAGKSAVGFKNVTGNEEFFNGHFPQRPVMPGVLICEAMAQVAGVLFLSQPEHKGKLPFFVGIDKIRFRKPVVPGDRLEMYVQTLRVRGNTGRVAVEAKVDGERVCDGELMFTIL